MVFVNDEVRLVCEDVGCPMGCAHEDETVLIGRDRLHDLPGEFAVVRCRHCGLIRTNPRPAPQSIGQYYPDDYGPYQGTLVATNQPPRSILPNWLRPVARKLLNQNTHRLPPQPVGRMLEIGCASGSFMYHMSTGGWAVRGIEFSDSAAEAARALGFEVHAGALETAPAPEQPYDLVVGWMVLEHLHDPVACLRKLREWVRPGGWLAISVPNAGSLEFRLFGRRWYALQVPTHLFHFTPETLSALLAKGGWRVERVFHQRVLSNFVASVGYCLADAGFSRLGRWLVAFPDRAGRLQYLLFPLASIMAALGQTGRMTVWARRES